MPLEAMRDIEGRTEDELRRLEKMEKHNDGIRRNSNGIADENSERRSASSMSCFGKQGAP